MLNQLPVTAIIALGSNLGDSITTLKQAIKQLDAIAEISVMHYSSFYLTKPVGYIEQTDFINAVCAIKTTLTPQQLLQKIQVIEQQLGRKRLFKNGPRTIDLDIIDYDQQIIISEDLVLPHPRAHLRAFVMVPFAEICADYVFNNQLITDWLTTLDKEDVQLISL